MVPLNKDLIVSRSYGAKKQALPDHSCVAEVWFSNDQDVLEDGH